MSYLYSLRSGLALKLPPARHRLRLHCAAAEPARAYSPSGWHTLAGLYSLPGQITCDWAGGGRALAPVTQRSVASGRPGCPATHYFLLGQLSTARRAGGGGVRERCNKRDLENAQGSRLRNTFPQLLRGRAWSCDSRDPEEASSGPVSINRQTRKFFVYFKR